MSSSDRKDENNVRVELKYCERCGGLWVRECGAGVVYCAKCEAEVADLPVPKKKSARVELPKRARTVVDRYRVEEDYLQAAGGVA